LAGRLLWVSLQEKEEKKGGGGRQLPKAWSRFGAKQFARRAARARALAARAATTRA
jgi:hypothetical protein